MVAPSRLKGKLMFELRMRWFDYLRETAGKVDPYVKAFLESHFGLHLETRKLLLSRYRFGKPQLRPALIRLAYELVGGSDWDITIPVCAAIEAKETAYYCLDDVIDKEANTQLILLGVGLHAIAYGMVCDVSRYLSKEHFLRILEEMFKLDESILQGAIIDSTMYGKDEQYYMGKVEGYNFWEQVLKIGGILGGGKDQAIELLGRIGKNIGMAHIIANDCFDFGKDLEDFRQGKSTLPIIYAFANTSGNDRSTLKFLFGKSNLLEGEKDTIRKIIVKCGAIEYGKKKALAMCADAVALLKQRFPESETRRLIEFSTTYTKKNKYFTLLEKCK